MRNILPLILLFWGVGLSAAGVEITVDFDHAAHVKNVFSKNKVDCSHCHNFKVDGEQKVVALTPEAKLSVLKIPLKQICHECHQSAQPQYNSAPKTCFTCHKSMEGIRKIKPSNHEPISWKSGHALDARVNGESCLNCHMTSQCSKCHLQRNDVQMRNHSINFRFTHSIQARSQPHRCDACHTKSYCVSCHLGKK